MATKPLFTSRRLISNGSFFTAKNLEWWDLAGISPAKNLEWWDLAGISLCGSAIRRLWNVPRDAVIQIGLSRTRVDGSYKIMAMPNYDRIRLEASSPHGRQRAELMLVNSNLLYRVQDWVKTGDVFVYVDILE